MEQEASRVRCVIIEADKEKHNGMQHNCPLLFGQVAEAGGRRWIEVDRGIVGCLDTRIVC